MKKIITILLIIFLSFITCFQDVFAIENQVNKIEAEQEKTNEITIWYVFRYFGDFFTETPDTYKYINLNFLNIKKWTALEQSLQKLVYNDKIKNTSSFIKHTDSMSAYVFYRFSEKILSIDLTLEKEKLKKRTVNLNDLKFIENTYNKNNKVYIQKPDNSIKNTILWDKEEIFNDVYSSIINWHYEKENIDNNQLIYSAIEWLAKWAWDKHTIYFPPVESKDFNNDLQWEYEWIGSYVEMTTPWELLITSPIPGGPAEKAWIKWWDIITEIDWKVITKDNSLKEVISWIKWPSWTTVILTAIRKWVELKIEVTREKIVIKNLEYEKINSYTYYLQLKGFWNWVSTEFKKALEEIENKSGIKKIIIDLRNNWGWYLSEVTEMLSYMVPKWEPTAVIKYRWSENKIYSKWYDLIDISKYRIVILQNSWTASASEIMIWTLKDYLNITTIWENTYWKGSVQTIKNYDDWSSFKYTIAKWFTWKTETWIDWIWIAPDIELELNIEAFKYNWKDNQLDKAIFK